MAAPQMMRRLSSSKKGTVWLNNVSKSARFATTAPESDCLLFSSSARRRTYLNIVATTAVATSGAVGCAWLAEKLQDGSYGFPTTAFADDMNSPLHDETLRSKYQEANCGRDSHAGIKAESSLVSRLSAVAPVRMSDEAHEIASFCHLVAWE